jgi:tetratricopeptide (TPR) repeat protein
VWVNFQREITTSINKGMIVMKTKLLCMTMMAFFINTLCTSQSQRTSVQWYLEGMEKINHKDYKAAIADFTSAITVDQKSDSSYAMRGSAKYSIKDYKGSIDDYTIAVNMNPINKNFLLGRGLAFLRDGQKARALSDLRIARAMGAPVSAKDWKECHTKR